MIGIKELIKKSCPVAMQEPLRKLVRQYRDAKYRLKLLLFKSKMNGYCPCCGKRFMSFVAGNYLNHPERFDRSRYEHTRQDVFCPYCRSMPRHRILASWCDDHKMLLRSSDILYFAPEYSMMQWMKRNGISCVTADLNHAADIIMDIQSTGLPDNSVDIVICNHVLEHVDDYKIALGEVLRILRNGGSFICSFPMDSNTDVIDEDPDIDSDEIRIHRYGQNDHKRVFGMNADKILIDAGFRVEKICGESYSDEILPVVGPADYDINTLFLCVKEK